MSGPNTLSREARIEAFGEEQVEHDEWWDHENDRVEEVLGEVTADVQERDDVQLIRRGVSVHQSGEHELRFRLAVAGEPWEETEASHEEVIDALFEYASQSINGGEKLRYHVEDIYGFGLAHLNALLDHEISTIGQVQRADRSELFEIFESHHQTPNCSTDELDSGGST